MIRKLLLVATAMLCFFLSILTKAAPESSDQLLRISYQSQATASMREYLLYLPRGYQDDGQTSWPVILFLHGHGERGNGRDELDYVMTHGPLLEAWIQRRPLPFIIISPQLPTEFGIEGIDDINRQMGVPRRLKKGVPKRTAGFKSTLSIARGSAAEFADGPYQRFEPYPVPGKVPEGWIRMDMDLLSMVDKVLNDFRGDAQRVYLTGLSYGGFGTFDMAAKYPERWAAIAAIVGTGKLADAKKIAEARIPTWLFGGGKDTVIKPHWLYEMARAMESAGHPALRFTVHEDMDHDAWKRVYEGEDLYNWMLKYSRDKRP